jgi:hypothetical protein
MPVNAFGFIPTRQVSFSNQEVQLQTALVRKIKHYLKLSLARSGKKPSPFSSTFNSLTLIAFPLRKMKGGRQTERPADREIQEKHRQAKTQKQTEICFVYFPALHKQFTEAQIA